MTVFSVQAKLPSHQHIRLLGNLPELGGWSPLDSLNLQPSSDDCGNYRTWTVSVDFASNQNISFRYFVCESLKGSTESAFSIVKCGPLQKISVLDEINGGVLDINDPTWCDGWLLSETEVHLTIHNATDFPIHLFDEKYSPETGSYKIKVLTMDMEQGKRCFSSRDTADVTIKVVGEYYCTVGNQGDCGITYDPSKHYTFVTRTLDLRYMMFKIEIYFVDNTSQEERIVGQGFIQPVHLKGSLGFIDVGMVCKELPVGSVKVEYVIIKPLEDKILHNIADWRDRNWERAETTLEMGHRGCGNTFRSLSQGIQENTIESFLMACENGADGLELDVHVTKDHQPIIYHDLYLKVPLQTKDETKCSRRMKTCDLTYQELEDLQIIHTTSPELNKELQHRKDVKQKLFPTLEEVLNTLPENFPMELEVKYLQTEKDQEEDDFMDVNLYVDILLKSIFKNIGNRKIVLMSFSPVIVQLLSRKQKKLPVKIAVCGETPKHPVYKDIRIRTLGRIIAFAESERILGVSSFCDHIIENPQILDEMKKRNLVLSTWGDNNNKKEMREKQRKMGVHVLCYDRIHEALRT